MREVKTGVPLGELNKDADHLLSHLEEKYYVPSLLVRSLEVMPSSVAMRCAVGEVWQPEKMDGMGMGFASCGFVWQQIQKNLSRYVLRRLGEVA